ncbi:MAG: DUF72 domain-containing protein [Polyangiales bacterium]
MNQLGLFRERAPDSPSDDEATRALARKLPPGVRFGTSSWSFAGWRGVVWPDDTWNDARCAREGLPVYAKHPLLRTVGIDRSFYGPLSLDESTRYASQMPADFKPIAKVWQEITKTGSDKRFSTTAFDEEVLAPMAGLAAHAGPLVLEFLAGETFDPEKLATFLHAVRPSPFSLTVEVRERRLLGPELGRALASAGVPLCFTFHPTMPSLAEQAAWAERHGLLEIPAPIAIRLMLPPSWSYESRKKACAPFDRLVDVQEEMRRHTVDLIARSVRAGREVFVVVNNKAEGSAPLTVRALAEALVR